jgi:RimJ/RimL family protein N-acetyltransferase
MRLEPVTLVGTHVQLEPLHPEHAVALCDAANRDRSTYGWTSVPANADAMTTYITGLRGDAAADTAMPFVQRRMSDGTLVGCTRFLDLRWWPGRAHPAEAEVGGTWLAADAQRTAINTEAKLLMLTHAFEHWNVERLAICTDERNERSRAAITRLGATFEGVLRRHRQQAGDLTQPGMPRNTAVYSILPAEWPDIKHRLELRVHGQ